MSFLLFQTNRTIEDLKAIDEDLDRLRKQIEERDCLITRLQLETKSKDQQIEYLTTRHRVSKKLLDMDYSTGISY